MSKEYQQKQAALTAEHIAKQDIVITTALIPGRPAPRLITKAMLKTMRQGSVVVDLAVERGGNVEGAVANKIVEVEGVKIIGFTNVPGRIAATASQLYARNLYAFVDIMTNKETKAFTIDRNDELVKATLLTFDGQVVHPRFAEETVKKDADKKPAPAKKADEKAEKPAKRTSSKSKEPAAKADKKTDEKGAK